MSTSKRPRTSPERNGAICALYLTGISLEEVGAKYGLTRERIRQILLRSGIHERHGLGEPKRAIQDRALQKREARLQKKRKRQDRRDKALELYMAGVRLAEIRRLTGFPPVYLATLARKHGVPQRSPLAAKPRGRLVPLYETIARRYFSGDAVEDIARDCDCVPGVVGQIARRTMPDGVRARRYVGGIVRNQPPPRPKRDPHTPIIEAFTGWSDALEAKLAELWPQHSASEIGEMLCVTRNAVIGKVHRLGLSRNQ